MILTGSSEVEVSVENDLLLKPISIDEQSLALSEGPNCPGTFQGKSQPS